MIVIGKGRKAQHEGLADLMDGMDMNINAKQVMKYLDTFYYVLKKNL